MITYAKQIADSLSKSERSRGSGKLTYKPFTLKDRKILKENIDKSIKWLYKKFNGAYDREFLEIKVNEIKSKMEGTVAPEQEERIKQRINPYYLPGLIPDKVISSELTAITMVIDQQLNVSLEGLRSKRRNENLVLARHAYGYLTKELGVGPSAAGRHICKDHSTILNNRRVATEMMETNKEWKEKIEGMLIQTKVLGGYN